MRQITTQGIVLTRTDFGEADRIITFITPDQGKIKAMARGVRRSKAKLAGSVEPFGVSDISVIEGRGEIKTLTSARLVRHYGNLIKDLERTNLAFEFMKLLDKATAEHPEADYFHLLDEALASLNDSNIPTDLTNLWFKMQILKLTGHTPNLHSDEAGKILVESKKYGFDFDKMNFVPEKRGKFRAEHIKFLRLGFGQNAPRALQRVNGVEDFIKACQGLVDTILKTYVRI